MQIYSIYKLKKDYVLNFYKLSMMNKYFVILQ